MESENKKPSNWYWKAFGIVLATAIVLWAIAIIAAKCFDFYISEDSAVITIIGVVAGIIVIGNYAQLAEIRNETNKKLDEVRNKLDLLEEYFNDSILKDLANILSKEDPFFRITTKNITSVKHIRNNVYRSKVRMIKRVGRQIITGEYDVNYYEVDISEGTCRLITKEDFEQDDN